MAQLDSFLRESGYRWDPSAFTPLCRAWANATDQERFDFIANVQMMSYDEFLKTIYWGIVSGWKVHIQKNCGCGSRWGLQVHHGTYAHHGEEHRYLNDLIVKCRLCHKEIHGLASAEELMALKRRREQAKDFRHLIQRTDRGGGIDAQADHCPRPLRTIRTGP